MIVLEEPKEEAVLQPKMVRVPRGPAQKEIDMHNATHLPHEEWCEFCIAGRGRNRPHMSKRPSAGQEEPEATQHVAGEDVGASEGPSSDPARQGGPVPRVCIDYFYVSSKPAGPSGGSRHVYQGAPKAITRVG